MELMNIIIRRRINMVCLTETIIAEIKYRDTENTKKLKIHNIDPGLQVIKNKK